MFLPSINFTAYGLKQIIILEVLLFNSDLTFFLCAIFIYSYPVTYRLIWTHLNKRKTCLKRYKFKNDWNSPSGCRDTAFLVWVCNFRSRGWKKSFVLKSLNFYAPTISNLLINRSEIQKRGFCRNTKDKTTHSLDTMWKWSSSHRCVALGCTGVDDVVFDDVPSGPGEETPRDASTHHGRCAAWRCWLCVCVLVVCVCVRGFLLLVADRLPN